MRCNCSKDDCCHGCAPARYSCMFDIQVSPYDPLTWLLNCNGTIHKIRVPDQKLNETDTKLTVNNSNSTLNYKAERHTDIVTGEQLGGIINFGDLRDVDVANARSCSIPVFDPYCSACGDGCRPVEARWTAYNIPDAGDCVIEEEDGYYKVLVKNDCGCIKECRLPVVPEGLTAVYYLRDSVPDDPDYPWYYGCYNENQINLYLQANVPQWFGKYDLEVTVNYGLQVEHSTRSPNTNFRSLVIPYVQGTTPDPTMRSYILQSQSTVYETSPYVPWGTVSLRNSFTIIAPKGKEVYLRHEFRLRTFDSRNDYVTNPLDGKRVPDAEATGIDNMLYTGSRLNALQIVVRPTRGFENTNPTKDEPRNQLDAVSDAWQQPVVQE